MTLPNFLVIGAPRCGTTSLYHYLKAHPQIFMSPVKEPRFFIYAGTSRPLPDAHSVADLAAYQRLFDAVKDEIAIGEATPTYIGRPGVLGKIKHHIPDCKLIAVLRNPVDRAISHYRLFVSQGKETRPLEDVIASEQALLPMHEVPFDCYAVPFGMYAVHLKRFLDHFPSEQLHVELFEDFIEDTRSALARIYRFLGVDTSFLPDVLHVYNAYQIPRSARVSSLLARDSYGKRLYQRLVPAGWRARANRTLHQLNTQPDSMVISPETRGQLKPLFHDDILRLETLLQRDLSGWLNE